ncbi:Chromosome segregation ATPase-like protein [Desulfofarcimen acetoxidans DSM 771]|uniref:Chromosome segregation ATPase-like protein n=1 Tax=Desulfofarcimen acetoxidans (strain ATCC 49208 / DSM 771 / KCTC 5769 / VKM B-1644 / 5575) TaxID=485916 RepID=C8W2T6_DESAS|nr:chromosome segregation ATPase [Desulfofarcimen acetoxidans]ACV61092.1 Chromosome segregation ATPase-like protein [Desulfofarcimen acetoxidans DSM 771]
MLYPVEMSFENARDFTKTKIYFSRAARAEDEIERFYRDNVLVGGLNGTGKSTLATVFMCLLNAQRDDAAPQDLISTNRLFTPEEPWEFAGKILFYNDGSLEDYSRYIEIEGRFQGYTDRNREVNRVAKKLFVIRESDDLSVWKSYRFSNEGLHKHMPLGQFDEMLVKMGISPKRYLLYWKQGETYKFTKIKDTERFQYFADMMDLTKDILALDKNLLEQANREAELEKLTLRLQNQQADLRKLEIDKERKEERDNLLYLEVSAYLGRVNALQCFNEEARIKLDETCRKLQVELQQSKEAAQDLEQRSGVLAGQDKTFQEKYRQLTGRRRQLEEELEQVRLRRKTADDFLRDNEKRYFEIRDLLDKLKNEDTSVEEIQRSLERLNGEIALLKVSLRQSREQIEKLGHESVALQADIEMKDKELEELKQLLVAAELVLREKASPERLEEEIERSADEIKSSEAAAEAETVRKERLLNKLAAYLFLLSKHRDMLQEDLQEMDVKLSDINRLLEEQKIEAERLQAEKQVIKLRMEQEPLAEIEKKFADLEEERQELSRSQRKAEQEAEKHRDLLGRVYRLLETALPAEEESYERLKTEAGRVSGQLEAYRTALSEKSEARTEVEKILKKYPLSLAQYHSQLSVMSQNLKELVAERTVLVEEGRRLDLLSENYSRGVYNQAQEKAVSRQSAGSFRFDEIFELAGAENQQEREKRLSLIKYALFTEAVSDELQPSGEYYHVGLFDYAPSSLEEPLPFGLKIKDEILQPENRGILLSKVPEISGDAAARAVSWLKEAAQLLTPEGYLKDRLGCRGYDPEEAIYFLSLTARENHRYRMAALREANAAEIIRIESGISDLEKEQEQTRERLQALAGMLSERERLARESSVLSENLSVLQQKEESLQEALERASYRLQVLKRVQAVLHSLKASLIVEDSLAVEQISQTEIPSYLERLVSEHASIVSRAERLTILLEELKSLRSELGRLAERLQEWMEKRNRYYDLEEQLRVKEEDYKEVDKLSAEQNRLLGVLKAEQEQHRKNIGQIKHRLEEFRRYFREMEPMETTAQISLFTLLEETARLYEDYRQVIDAIEVSVKDWQRRRTEASDRIDRLKAELAAVWQAQADLIKSQDKKTLENTLSVLKVDLDKLRVSQQYLERHAIEAKENELRQAEEQAGSFRKIVDRHSTVDWSFHALYQEQEEEARNLTRHYADLMEADRELALQLEQNDLEWQKVRSALRKLEEELKEKINGQIQNQAGLAEAEEKLSGYHKDLVILPVEEEAEARYKELLLLDAGATALSLGEMLPSLRVLYRAKFFDSVEEGWMPVFEDYLAAVQVEKIAIEMESEYRAGLQLARDTMKRIINTLKKQVQENASQQYHLAQKQYETLIKEKRQAEQAAASLRQAVAEQHKMAEGLIDSSVRSVFRNFQQVLDRLGYQAQLNYVNKEQGEGCRRLVLKFRKKNEKAFRTVNEHGGLSGGEHAAVSLMLMYAIMVVKENNMGIKSGGYLLLDEWDANLDTINSRQVFEILKKLGKKIISITPRSHSQTYLEEFGLVVRVLQSKGHSIVSILDKQADRVNIEEMFEQMEQEGASFSN